MNAPMLLSELVIDSFAGGGGASEGIRAALGRDPDVALNHDRLALAMHRANHPGTHHIEEDVVTVDARKMCGGRPIGMLWMSPDCKDHSKAKGGKPRDKNIRGLAWTVVGWVKRLPQWQRPRVVFLENVEEFADWSPLRPDGTRCPAQKGSIFKEFVRAWEALGYVVEWRERRACDSGAPTIRKRLYMIMRRDGLPVVWPAATHGDPRSEAVSSGRLRPWRAAAEIIDWSLPCPSIFETSAEIKARFGIRAIRPLAENTMARIAKGTMRYVVNAAKPFIVQVNHGRGTAGRAHEVDAPSPTVTGSRGEALATPFIAGLAHGDSGGRSRRADEPLHTLTASRKDQDQVVAPFVTKFNSGATGHPIDDPLHTITSHASDTHGGGAAPLGIVTPVIVPTANEGSSAAVHLSRQFGASVGSGADSPVGTITAGGAGKAAVVAAFLAQHNEGPRPPRGRPVDEPISTITSTGGQLGLVAAHLLNLRGSDRRDSPVDQPALTFSAGGNHAAAVYAFLAKYYGEGVPSQPVDEPLHTVTTRPRHGLVTVRVAGEPFVVVDIGMRMLTPRERFNAQSLRPDYIIDYGLLDDGSRVAFTLEQQGRFCGNSVCPVEAATLVAANYSVQQVRRPRALSAAPLLEAAE